MSQTTVRLFIMCVAANCIANITWWLQPYLMTFLIEGRALHEGSAGLLISLEIGSIAVGSAALTALGANATLLKRAAIFGSLLAVAAGFATLISTSFLTLAISRIGVGLSTGAIIMVANTLTARFSNPDRAFANMTFINIVFGTLLSNALPWFNNLVGSHSPYVAAAVTLAILAVIVMQMPRPAELSTGNDGHELSSGLPKSVKVRITALALAIFLIAMCSGVIWPYYAIVGAAAGLSEIEVINAISLSIFTALIGCGLAAVVGKFMSRNVAITIGTLILAVAILVITSSPSATAFKFAACFQVAAIFYIAPLLFGAAAELDKSGKGSSILGSAFYFAGGVSPMVGGYLSATIGLSTVGGLIVGICVVVLILVIGFGSARETFLIKQTEA